MLEHFLREDWLFTILSFAEQRKISTEILLNEELSSKFYMTPKQLEKYLRLFNQNQYGKRLLNYKKNDIWIKLDEVNEAMERLRQMKSLIDSF